MKISCRLLANGARVPSGLRTPGILRRVEDGMELPLERLAAQMRGPAEDSHLRLGDQHRFIIH